jgi:hypothetical protein
MNGNQASESDRVWPKLTLLPLPAKALVTAIMMTMAFAMTGALGQIVIHDIIPTFFSNQALQGHSKHSAQETDLSVSVAKKESARLRGDLFEEIPARPENNVAQPLYQTEQFVWTLKWAHIHLFGINMIFIFMGTVTLFLDLSSKLRTWLIVLPFLGVLIDIAAMWLKGYVSPAFFWLHIPGGGLFGFVFGFVTLRAFWEMWRPVSIQKNKGFSFTS